jgi:hypothetical protein
VRVNAYREPGPADRDRPRRQSQYQAPIEEERTVVNAGRLWAGGMAAAVVAGLVALVGVLVVRVVFKLPLLGSSKSAFGDSRTVTLVALAVAAALLATALAHLLLISTPSPQSYFGWIVGLVTVAAVVYPFLSSQKIAVQVAQAVINLVIGIAIGGLVSQAAAAASRTTLTRR